ncbi:alpha-mannosidase [Paenibacillus psychroresistens]|uniref:Alpha-mannosidase n=1 Tax=Paenibacillus psychroresistens TaxID=1778678 RepID=A0A6B8RF31_9BACL|nr:alpha-mannosidase [Paenibacillus psychroresistens]QGQ94334.1 alpha-mannosidase [Paenibacillus psychroresistens]
MKRIHLICNAHLDPMWLWEWEEGAAEAISTFRVAADFCEEYEGFVFNHNEVILYKWVEEYEPALFVRIQKLVAQGKWNIMGGWYLQPDCNMPSGESFVRQMLFGRHYFQEKFGVIPTTAINFDPFGHTRGLVQLMTKAGYDSYVFCRPPQSDCPLPADEFIWCGYDGSEMVGHRAFDYYASERGKAHEKVKKFIENYPSREEGMVLWGIGNHGGGPSREDLANLTKMMEAAQEAEIVHSTPEAYFRGMAKTNSPLPRYEKDLNAWAPGCYTSQIRIKQKHRLLENELYMTEKMLSSAAIQGKLSYPRDQLHDATCDLLTAEFHDILPGSSIQPVEESSLRLMDHGLELLSRLKARAFFALADGQPKAKEGQIPIMVYNPHPHIIKGTIECEFNLADMNWDMDKYTWPLVYCGDQRIPSQVEKELGNLTLDWRKRVIFHADLQPGQMNRFDCKLEMLTGRKKNELHANNRKIHFETTELEAVINCETGLLDTYKIHGKEMLEPHAFQPIVMVDNNDPWGSRVQEFREINGKFRLMSREEGMQFSGLSENLLESVRIVEDGEVRAVVEALFSYGNSFIVLMYKLPKHGTEMEVQVRVQWNEKSKMLKLSIPTLYKDASFIGQVACGVAKLPDTGKEAVAQKWVAVISESNNQAVTCINDGTYGCDYKDGEIRLSLLRSSAYSALELGIERPLIVQDRFLTRIDQGERIYHFWLNGGPLAERMEQIDREALFHNERPFALSFFPSGEGELPLPLMQLSDSAVQLMSFKQAERSDDYIIRLFESTGLVREFKLSIPVLGIVQKLAIGEFEVKTLRLNLKTKTLMETTLMEMETH